MNINTQKLTNIPKLFGESWTNKQALLKKKSLKLLQNLIKRGTMYKT
ncbi:hypothetical protein MICAF_1820003 [Microcystis aeruginosa PCC 9807]|uniref:Uncharacterized protein n=1 Tax=Microcystis aeruginosa PCC 9807 TaxID=1160283 RepID=I4H2E1_MICAE|nr:hypothetical protein MICAF_1820003 [Microcystis aeruginosa PCC 9807]